MHLRGEFDRLPVGNYFQGGARRNYVGIDHHRQYSHMTLMDQEGQVLRFGRVPNLRSEMERFRKAGYRKPLQKKFRLIIDLIYQKSLN